VETLSASGRDDIESVVRCTVVDRLAPAATPSRGSADGVGFVAASLLRPGAARRIVRALPASERWSIAAS
jgi:hypothetical protein